MPLVVIAARTRIRETGYRVRVEAARIDSRPWLVVLLVTLLVFAGSFEIGRATRPPAQSAAVEIPVESSIAFLPAGIPAGLSAMPPIATLVSHTTTHHSSPAQRVAAVASPAPAPVAVIRPFVPVSAPTPAPASTPSPGTGTPPSSPGGSRQGGGASSGGSGSGAGNGGGSSGNGSGGGGSFDSSG